MRQSDLSSSVAAAPEAALARGTALGRFVVLGLVGRGAMGEVYGAYDPELDRKIAIKLVRARADRGGDTADGRTRLMREAQATAKISHPNVVVVYDAGTFGDRVFIAMEFVEGHTLRYWLQEKERSWQEIVEAFVAAGRGLAAAHDKELVHRDFKPDNVMVATGGQVRVMDFGLARIADGVADDVAARAADGVAPLTTSARIVDLDATPFLSDSPLDGATSTMAFRDKITATGALLGTPAYMSPEQFQGRPADTRSDQFSFCVALHEAVHGTRPFSGRTLEELAHSVVRGQLAEPPASVRVPARIRKALERGLRANPDERFPTMHALLAEIDKGAGAGRGGFASGAAAKLAGVWEAPVAGHSVEAPAKEAIRQAFLSTGKIYAAAAFAGASASLDRYAESWSELYIEVCEATHVRGDQSAEVLDLRMTCLLEGLADLKALCRLFRSATAEVVENAVKAANALGTLERVRDVKLLRALIRPPDDDATREAVDQIRARLVNLRALGRVGRVADGLDAAALVEEARRVGYGPMLAEALFVYGTLELEAARMQTVATTLEDAVWTAEAARHDEVAVAAACHLIYLTGYQQRRFDVGEIWSRHAETVLRRMGDGHDQLWGWYFNNRATMREEQGRLGDAVADARRAVAAKESAMGAESTDLGLSFNNLANHLASGGDFVAALEASEKALGVLMRTLGPDHPRTAFVLMNQGQFLCRLLRFEEAREAAARALTIFERDMPPDCLMMSFPLRTIGLALLGMRRFAEAVTTLERATRIRDLLENKPLRLAEIHFALARALHEHGGEPERALELGRRARREYELSAATPVVKLDLAELERWLLARSA